jgi:hypothetical protein
VPILVYILNILSGWNWGPINVGVRTVLVVGVVWCLLEVWRVLLLKLLLMLIVSSVAYWLWLLDDALVVDSGRIVDG